ncbi:hypothetical protein FBQ97_19790, partial [Acidobacteria bacterium ACD]|nr:hypothetical protein [Acidobacteria bacterium ACD]
GSEAGAPDVAVVSGQPVVAWREYAGRYLRVARWNGSSWTVIRSLDARPETFAFAVVEGSGSTLFLARQSGPSIVVESWNGTSWSAWPDPVAAFPGKTVSVLDLAVLDGEPYLMLMVGGDVRVARLSAGVTTCSSFSLSSTLALPNAAAGSTTVTVTGSPTGCQGGGWTASGNGSWITVSPASGTGSGAVTVSWSANLSADSRSGVATVAAKSFSVLQAGAPHSCTADATTLCLLGNRFRVTSTYRDYGGGTGTGKAVPLTTDTGYFWYFTSANVEVVAKMVSFCSGGTHNVGVYANGLTDLGVTITVTDTVTGLTVNYANPLGTGFRLIRDGPFSCSQGASAPAPEATVVVAGPGPSPEPGAGWVLRSVAAVEPSAGCTPDTTSLCLLNDRFRVTSTYRDYGGGTGSGKAVRLTSDTGYFWFFEPANVEVVAKMVSFCSSSTHNVGVYANGLTDLAVTLTVTDTQMGLVRSYSNALGRPFELIRDGPFACP